MGTSAQKFDPKNNSIGFLRLILSIAVIYSHSFELGGYGHDFISNLTENQYNIGSFAVDGFFACSGYLITASYFRSKSLLVFLWHRVLRLIPGYWVAISFAGLILPLFFSESSNLKYVIKNILVPVRSIILLIISVNNSLVPSTFDLGIIKKAVDGQPYLPPLFENNPFPKVIDGSLWTLDPEFRCYLIIALIGFLGFLNKKTVLGLFLFSLLASLFYFSRHPLNILANGYRFPVHFLAGSIFYFWSFPLNWKIALASFLVAVGSVFKGVYPVVSAPVTVCIFFWLATVLPFQKVFRQRDYSYGIYVYAFVVQQTLSAYHFNQFPFFFYFSLSIILTFPLAVLSWHFVEKPSLKLKSIFGNN